RNLNIAYPSTTEQTIISSLLSLIDERIATQNKIIEKLETLIKGIVDFIFTYYKFTTIPFKDVYSCAGEGGTPATSNPEYYKSGTIPFIKIDDLQNKYIESNKDYITELGLQKSSAWIVPTNSIIYSNGATIGKVSINKYPVCTKQGILGIAPKANMNVEFLYYFMTSTMFAKAIERVVTEGTMRTAYLKDINHILCPIPNSNEQNKIAKLLSALSAKLENEIIFQRKLQKQKEFLLSQMFI
ncbi:restriction endonuclease subunit S, partial [uncultured Alistipes sp.]